MKPLIFTLVGPDKPGLISNLSKAVFERGGNWLGSNFSHMAGHFAGFVHIDLPAEKHDELIALFDQHPDLRIHLVSAQAAVIQGQQTAQINIMGNDKAGIVQELTRVLNQFNLNIMQFDSSCTSAPNWGSPLFKAKAIVEIAPDVELVSLREALENIANDLMVDVELS
ncbi:glycine cleavage system protein R [Paraglaciecola hydrolytica]|uniref:Glycine cleavage system transcriptional repressor n=1 Tax=Paraglaciecola hydrolytica TaxID=1799789 RepID=A0A148KL46_9ALTE|nr:ACT domain-containing protein [Paraglaciecola hydrolytica]KXI26985.1 glycine cleavage system protein R [Paraglaciecola hydrolytica]